MYAQPAFKVHHAMALAFAAARGFGLVVSCAGGRPVASLLPFCIVEADGRVPRAQFHVARGNPLGDLAEKGGIWMIAVAGADTYVSPDWYASAGQVPTWLYEAAQLSGPVRVLPGEQTADHLDRLGTQFESWLAPKPPWTAEKVPPARRAAMQKAIVAIELTIETVEGSFKLNQHKTDADYASVARALSQQGDQSANAIAARMVALKPHLAYE
jgi:transcriptional regulator